MMLMSETDISSIDAVYNRPAAGSRTRTLDSECPGDETQERRRPALAMAFAIVISEELSTKPRAFPMDRYCVKIFPWTVILRVRLRGISLMATTQRWGM